MEELFPRLPEEDVKSSLEKYERVVLAGKGYFSAERRAVRRLQSALNQKKITVVSSAFSRCSFKWN